MAQKLGDLIQSSPTPAWRQLSRRPWHCRVLPREFYPVISRPSWTT